jgi:hypothetical protein
MTTPAPAPALPATPPSAVTIAAVRTLSPIIVTIVAGLLLKANVHLDSTTLVTAVAWAIGGVLGFVWKLGVGWLEQHKSPLWGWLFGIAKAPAYAPGPAPQAAPYVGTHDAGLSEIGIIVVAVLVAVAVVIIAHAAGWF